MQGFIANVLLDLKKKKVDFSELTFILPSRRSGVFLKHELSNLVTQSIFSPNIFSVEDFVEEISELRSISNVDLLFEFYSIYLKVDETSEKEPFDSFSNWAHILLQDFNEIDRFLIDPNQLFDYLTAVKKLEDWSLEANNESSKRYLRLWKNLSHFYKRLTTSLLYKGLGYQGLIYREAVNNLASYIQTNTDKKYIFLGFNALNKAETILIQEFLETGLAHIYWDSDHTFVQDSLHTAGMFIREHKEWSFFKSNPFNWISDNYSNPKKITAIGTPKSIGQAKSIGEILIKKDSYDNIALVLADENLLSPVLSALPQNLNNLNITMGLPLRNIPIASLFERLFLIHKNAPPKYYYKDVINLLSHQSIQEFFRVIKSNSTDKIVTKIADNNLIQLSLEDIEELSADNHPVIHSLFSSWDDSPQKAIDTCIELIYQLKKAFSLNKKQNQLNLEYLYRFYELFTTLAKLNNTYGYIDSIKVLHGLFCELLSFESLNFRGEPLQGLQIMGMLESRVLDFETVIISSVNEGILPTGKTDNSFIPFDIKLQYGLPTYKEKDAVYCYHFYRLIQRAKHVYLIYNTEPDVLMGGEKSRFITQMEVEDIHKIEHLIYAPENHPSRHIETMVQKTPKLVNQLQELASKGFSPSSLSNYIRNPIDFYAEKILGIKEYNEVEETVAANTLGTVVHNSLEDFYKPFEEQIINESDLKAMFLKIDSTVKLHFKRVYKKGNIDRGKNLIVFEIAKRYVKNFIQSEIELLKKGHEIKILHTELELRAPLNIGCLDTSINLVGTIDRVDLFDGVLRIIDYKSGKVERPQLEIVDWEEITSDYKKYSKSFQVLTYAYMLNQLQPFKGPVEAGIISFKNQKSGFLKFAKKDEHGQRAKKETLITQNTLANFSEELKALILEIMNPEIPFVEKEIS